MRVLLIEDNPSLSRLLELELEDEGVDVTIATNGEDGLDLAIRLPFDAIILDIMLPKMNGIEVLKEFRKSDKDTPLMMLTAQATMTTTVECLELGADDYLKKPFEVIELVARLKSITRRSRKSNEHLLKVGQAELNFKNTVATLNGVEVMLKKQEWQVLRALLSRRGRTVSKDVLYECLTNEDVFSESNLIEVLVYGLRQKLGKEIIRNKRGLGYAII